MEHKKLKVGLIGAGIFGGYHANKLSEHDRVDFIGVSDPDMDRASALAEKHGVESYGKSADLFSVAADIMTMIRGIPLSLQV